MSAASLSYRDLLKISWFFYWRIAVATSALSVTVTIALMILAGYEEPPPELPLTLSIGVFATVAVLHLTLVLPLVFRSFARKRFRTIIVDTTAEPSTRRRPHEYLTRVAFGALLTLDILFVTALVLLIDLYLSTFFISADTYDIKGPPAIMQQLHEVLMVPAAIVIVFPIAINMLLRHRFVRRRLHVAVRPDRVRDVPPPAPGPILPGVPIIALIGGLGLLSLQDLYLSILILLILAFTVLLGLIAERRVRRYGSAVRMVSRLARRDVSDPDVERAARTLEVVGQAARTLVAGVALYTSFSATFLATADSFGDFIGRSDCLAQQVIFKIDRPALRSALRGQTAGESRQIPAEHFHFVMHPPYTSALIHIDFAELLKAPSVDFDPSTLARLDFGLRRSVFIWVLFLLLTALGIANLRRIAQLSGGRNVHEWWFLANRLGGTVLTIILVLVAEQVLASLVVAPWLKQWPGGSCPVPPLPLAAGRAVAYGLPIALVCTALSALLLPSVSAPALLYLLRMGAFPPRLRPATPRGEEVAGESIVHLSDLHLTTKAGLLEEGEEREELRHPNRILADVIAMLPESSSPRGRLALLTGDLTDEGAADEYTLLEAALGALERKGYCWLAVPGNHDLVLQRTWSGGELHVPREQRAAARKERYARRVLRRMVLQSDIDFLTVSPEADRLRSLQNQLEHCPTGDRDNGEDWFDEIFPIGATRTILGVRLLCILLNSNVRRGRTLIDNAIGRVGPAQLHRTRVLSAAVTADVRMLVLHHHVAAHPRIGLGYRLTDPFDGLVLCEDSREILKTAESIGVTTLVHGHKHIGFTGQWHNLWVHSAPSSTVGSGLDGPGFDLLSVHSGGLHSARRVFVR
jgi:hypothetical protein